MDEKAATNVAEALGASAWQSGGDIWLVLKERPDGHLVVISDEVVCEYASRTAFQAGAKELASVGLC